jgi:uncharacterized OB-fold protein
MPDPFPHSIHEYRTAYEEGRGLLGFRSACGFTTATWGLACPACGQRDLAEVNLSGQGTIAAFTVQTVPSEEFLNDAPYAYVLVDLTEGGRLTGWIEGVATERELSIGEAVEWVASYKPGVHFRRRNPPAPTGP